MLTHDWQPIERGFRCTGCGAWSAKGKSTGECTPTTEPIAITKPPTERPRRKMNRGVCANQGGPTDRKLSCGCPSQEPYQVYWCNLLWSECAKFVDDRVINKGVVCCRRCESFVPIVQD